MAGDNKNKELPDIQYWDVNNLYDWAKSQKLPVNNFKWIKDTLKEIFFEVDVQCLEKLH